MPSPVAVKLGAGIHSRVEVLAEARNRSPHWIMRDAIAQYVEREEKRKAFQQDGIRAWNANQETGLHVTHAEADPWLSQLAAGDDQETPERHN